jgi:uncharacterized repeat protein (TIGR01451 family)
LVSRGCALGVVAIGFAFVGAGCIVPPPPPPSTDLGVSQTVDNDAPAFAQHVLLTTDVKNLGSVDATGVTVSVALPTGMSFVNASDGYDAGTGVWTIGSIAGGADAQLTITAAAGDVAVGDRTVSATVHASTADTNTANDTASVTVRSLPANLAVTIVPDPGNPQFIDRSAPGTVTWTMSVVNENDAAAPINDLQTSWECSTVSFNPCPDWIGLTEYNQPLTITMSDFNVDTYTLNAFVDTDDPNYVSPAQSSITFTTTDSGGGS